ncbi:hypothetical protein [Brevundimonas viscosa]|uniref:Membrane domain of glycerophosphoryl diester phosphodiesterase n=1 Tax=Brevundimonas viscosa TaxID=871741 RepID=A0A1I6PXT2_9CAUL|nr:hypothetical protein [Brevundimonas viscosa]SFS45003.1 hypothetical protein SAMN05192570_1382 [Brevundimonas viscosa]
MAFSATDAVFEGFRVVRRRPMTLVWWSLFYMVVMALVMAAIGGSLIRLVNAAEALEAAGTPSPEDFMPIFQLYMSVFAVVLPISLAAGAVVYAAVSRAVLRPEESRFGYLRFGMDEVRVLVVTVALGLMFMALGGVTFTLVGIVGGLAASLEAPWLWLVAVLLGLAALGGLIWLGVRLCLAVPITVGERRIAILDSFRLTRGRFWPLLGMAILAGVLSLVVGLLGSLVLTPLQFLTGGMTGLQDLEGAALAEILQTAWPMILVWIVTNAIVSALQVAVVYAPFSAAYRSITADGPRAA